MGYFLVNISILVTLQAYKWPLQPIGGLQCLPLENHETNIVQPFSTFSYKISVPLKLASSHAIEIQVVETSNIKKATRRIFLAGFGILIWKILQILLCCLSICICIHTREVLLCLLWMCCIYNIQSQNIPYTVPGIELSYVDHKSDFQINTDFHLIPKPCI